MTTQIRKPEQFFRANFEVRALRKKDAKGGRSRVLRFIGSTEQVARDGMIIRATGWETREYEKNPVVLWAHDYFGLPVGHCVNLERDTEKGRLIFDIEFLKRSEYEMADTVYRLAKRGILRATSVGFIVKETREPNEEEQRMGAMAVCTRAELLEISIVPVPADTDALIVGKAARAGDVRKGDLALVRSFMERPYEGPPDHADKVTRIQSVRALTTLVSQMQRALREKSKMVKRMLEETEADFRAELREMAEFDESTFDTAVFQEEPLVELDVAMLLETGEVAAQCVKFPKDVWTDVDAQAFLDEQLDALLAWTGASEEAPADDEPADEGEVEEQAEDEPADEGSGKPSMEIPDDVLAQLDEDRKEELAQDAETLRAISEALLAASETIMAVADDLDPASGEPSGEEVSGDEVVEGEETVEQSALNVQDQTIRALSLGVQRLAAGTMGGVIRTMVENAVAEQVGAVTEEIRALRDAIQRSRTVVTPAKRKGGRPARPAARRTPQGGGTPSTYGKGLRALKDAAAGR